MSASLKNMRWIALTYLLTLASCHQAVPRPASCVEARDPKLIVQRCYGGDLRKDRYVGDTICFPFGPSQRLTGIWHVELEGSYFALSSDGKQTRDVWLQVPNPPRSAVASMQGDTPRDFAITIDGRRSLCPAGFGHMGMSPNEIIADKLISIVPATLS